MKTNLLFCLFLFLFQSVFAQGTLSSCGIFDNGPIHVQQAITEIPIDIYTTGPNSLEDNPLVEVKIQLSHYWIGDVAISLRSPNGTEYLIVGDADNNFNGCGQTGSGLFDLSIIQGFFNPLTNGLNYNDICPWGDCTGYYTVFNPYAGGYFYSNVLDAEACPTGDLNDFNEPGGTITGTWTLRVACVCALELGNDFFIQSCGLAFENQEDIFCVNEAPVGNYEPVALNACLGEPITMTSDLPDWNSRWEFSNGDIIETEGNVLETTINNYAEYFTVEVSSIDFPASSDNTQLFTLFPSYCEDLSIELATLTQSSACFEGAISNVDLCEGGRSDFDLIVSDSETCLLFTPSDFSCETVCVRYIEEDIPHDVTIEICAVEGLTDAPELDLQGQIEIPTNSSTTRTFSIFPNPNSGILNFSFEREGIRTVRIVNVFGEKIYQNETRSLVNRIDISKYPSGIYWIVSEEGSQKFVKK